MAPQLLVLGNIVKDITPNGWRPGGSVLYAARQAQLLDIDVGVVTSCGRDIDPYKLLSGMPVLTRFSDQTTVFDNRTEGGKRTQLLLATGETLNYDDIPFEWQGEMQMALLATVYRDTAPELAARLKAEGALVGIAAQGLLRRLDGENVLPGEVESEPAWLACDLIFVSEEDVTEPDAVSQWAREGRIVVLTRGAKGCSVWSDGERVDFPAIAADEVDSTGAGDVFAVAFLVRYTETKDVATAARFASAASALCIGAEGADGLGDRLDIVMLAQAGGDIVTLVVAITNQKGGVGKTTTAINLGYELASRGIRVLLVDLDPQANATAGLGLSRRSEKTVYDVLLDETPLSEVVIHTGQANFDLAPSGPDLAGAEVELVPLMAREQRMKRALESLEGYEMAIIDCAPSLGLLTLNALNAADEVLVPVQCEYLALEGLGQLTHTLEAVRRNLNPRLHLGGLLLTMYDARTNLCQQVAAEVRSHFPETFETVIPRNVRVSEAPSHGLPIGAYAATSPAAKAYAALAAEVAALFLPDRDAAEAKR